MAHSELFIVFPVLEGTEGIPLYIKTVDIQDGKDLCNVINRIAEIEEIFSIENYEGYYDEVNVRAFLKSFEIDSGDYPDPQTRFRVIMQRWGQNWRDDRKNDVSDSFFYNNMEINDDTICEVTKRKLETADTNTFLLVNQDAVPNTSGVISATFRGKEISVDIRDAGIRAIARWFEGNRRPRRSFNLNPKHGEFGKGAHLSHRGDKVSTLRCGRDEAQVLLDKAIGKNGKVLFAYDEKNRQYIEFRQERENVYHGFHLDEEDEGRVSTGIKNAIKKIATQ